MRESMKQAGMKQQDMPMSRIVKRAAALATLPLLLAGCISFGPEPPESLLTLTAMAEPGAGTLQTGTEETAIAIEEPTVPQRLDVPRVPVQIDATSVAYLENAFWVDKPARLFRGLLAETIRAQTGRIVIDEENYAISPETNLRGALREFGYDARTSSVVVRYDAIRSVGGEVIQSRRFESIVPGVVAEAAPVGAALNQAANDVARQVADWIG